MCIPVFKDDSNSLLPAVQWERHRGFRLASAFTERRECQRGMLLQDGQGFLDRQVKRKNAREVGRMRCAERPLLEKENPTTRVDRCERHATRHTHVLCVNLLPSPFSYSSPSLSLLPSPSFPPPYVYACARALVRSR